MQNRNFVRPVSEDPRRAPAWERPAVALAAVLAATAVWLAGSRWGAAVSPDSTVYLSAAGNLAKGRGLVTFDGEPLVSWAPLYPALLALLQKLGLGALEVARWLGVLGVGRAVLLAHGWLRRHVMSPVVRVLAVAAVACSTAILRDALFVWSEILFLLFVFGCLMELESFLAAPRRWTLFRAAVAAALAALTRYVGVTAGLVGVGVTLFAPGARPARRRIADALLFGVVAFGPLGLWLARNVRVSGALVYLAQPHPSASPGQIAFDGFQVMAQEWLPYAVPHGLRALIVVAVLALVVVAVARSRARASLAPAAYWIVLYVATLLAGASRIAVEPISQRLVSPLLVPLLVLGARAADQVRPRAWRAVVLVATVAWLGYSAARAHSHLYGYYRTGAESYTAPEWRHSELAAALRASPPDTVYGNGPDAVYFLAGQPAKFSPRRTYYASDEKVTGDMPRFERTVARQPVRLAWFRALGARTFLYSPEELREQFEVRRAASFADGEIDGIEPGKKSPKN
jgi:hypothetical protein